MYYPSSKNKGADQLCSYCTAYLHLCFCICTCWFSDATAHFQFVLYFHSIEMFNTYKDCVFSNLAGCGTEIKGGVYFTVEQILKETLDTCANEVPVDIPAIL